MSTIHDFIKIARLARNNLLVLQDKSMSVVASHLRSILKLKKRNLINAGKFAELQHLHGLSDYAALEAVSDDDVSAYLASIKSASTRTYAKTICRLYLGSTVHVARNIIDKSGNRVEGNRFVKNWMTPQLAQQLFENMTLLATPHTVQTLLACCVQLGTAMRATTVQSLTYSDVSTLLNGGSIIVLIKKNMVTRNKRCIKYFLSTDLDETMMVVRGEPIINYAMRALGQVSNIDHPCATLSRKFFKACQPMQREKFGIKDQNVKYQYGSGFHEIRRYTLSYMYNKLGANPNRLQIVADIADHTSASATTERYTRNKIEPDQY